MIMLKIQQFIKEPFRIYVQISYLFNDSNIMILSEKLNLLYLWTFQKVFEIIYHQLFQDILAQKKPEKTLWFIFFLR